MLQAEEPPYPKGRYAAFLVSVLFLAWVMAFMDRQIVTLLLPSLKADLGVSDTQVSLIQGMAFASMYAVAGLPLGWIADRTNRRNLLVVGVAFWSLATMACGLTETFWQLFAARMAVGLGEACLGPACVSIMADYFRPTQRGKAMAALQTGAPLGGASSLFFGGMLLTSLAQGSGPFAALFEGWAPWKVVFIAIGAPGLVVALLVATLKEPPRRDYAAKAESGGPQLSLLAFFRAHPRTLALFFGAYTSMLIVGYSVGSWAPTVLMRIYGMAPSQAGPTYGTIQLLCSATAGICSGFVSDALVRRRPLNGRVLIPLAVLPLELCALATFALADHVAMLVAVLAVSSFTTAFVSAIWSPALQDLVPNQLRGRFMAILLLVGNVVGYGGAPILVALVTDQVFRDEMMLQKSVGLVAFSAASLAFLLALGLPRSYAKARRAAMVAAQPG
jgi:MFS family permease